MLRRYDTEYYAQYLSKYWSSFLVEDLSPVIFDENAWDHLVLEGDIKVCCSVQSMRRHVLMVDV